MDGNRSNYNERDPGPVPDRWLLCPRMSESFILDRFLAFKTPLNFRFASKLAKEHQFQPEMVFSWMKIYKVSLQMHLASDSRTPTLLNCFILSMIIAFISFMTYATSNLELRFCLLEERNEYRNVYCLHV